MASLKIDTNQLVAQNHPEWFGGGQSFLLGEMTKALVPSDFWYQLLGSIGQGDRVSDSLAELQERAGSVFVTGSAVKEVWPNYKSPEAERVLPGLINPGLIAGVKLARFGGCLDVQRLSAAEYLTTHLATYLLPPNIDVRFEKTEWTGESALEMISIIASKFTKMQGWVGCVIQDGSTKELVFTNPGCEAAAVCFYFKEQERSGRGLLTTEQWEGITNARLWRRVEVKRDKSGKIIGESPARISSKGDLWCMESQAIASIGQSSELLARSIREIAMTGRMPKNLRVETFGDPAMLENKWTLRQWMMYVSNLMHAVFNDPIETQEMLEMIGATKRWVKDGWPTSAEQVLTDIMSCDGYDEWKKILGSADDILMKLGQVVPGGRKGMKLADLAPLIALLSPKGIGVREVLAMVPESDQREKVVKVL